MKIIKNSPFLKKIILVLIIGLPLIIPLHTLFTGNIGFWYDPARDFFTALSNLQKFTLIGPTSGIPGLFYGPYWIWLLSLGLIFSKEPQWVVFMTLSIPYFIITPVVFFQFRKIWDLTTSTIMWLFFAFSNAVYYAVNPWNPHPAPLLFIVLIYFIIFTDFTRQNKKTSFVMLMIGLITGLIVNFHISFGLGVFLGTSFFFLIYFFKDVIMSRKILRKRIFGNLMLIALFGVGAIVTFAPFFVFEVRHGFGQINTLLSTLQSEHAVVGVKGLTRQQIVGSFFEKGAGVLKIPLSYFISVLAGVIIYLVYIIKSKRAKFIEKEKKLLGYLISISLSILVIYLSSKNPVWSYHFIGVEIIFIFLFGVAAAKSSVLKKASLVCITIIAIVSFANFASSVYSNFSVDPTSLAAKKDVVKMIESDSAGKPYTIFAYSPSIYQYDYSYLFTVLVKIDVPFDPGQNPTDSKLVYLIIPETTSETKKDFINYRTPEERYTSLKEFNHLDRISVIKRERKEKN